MAVSDVGFDFDALLDVDVRDVFQLPAQVLVTSSAKSSCHPNYKGGNANAAQILCLLQ